MRRGRGFAASTSQRVKSRDEGRCRVCFNVNPDAAHATPKSIGGCADPACVVPLCRSCHRLYDHEKRLDLLPYMTREEQAHAVAHLGIIGALERTTNTGWLPEAA